jgi:hypothetical protein
VLPADSLYDHRTYALHSDLVENGPKCPVGDLVFAGFLFLIILVIKNKKPGSGPSLFLKEDYLASCMISLWSRPQNDLAAFLFLTAAPYLVALALPPHLPKSNSPHPIIASWRSSLHLLAQRKGCDKAAVLPACVIYILHFHRGQDRRLGNISILKPPSP